jgi:hypothetical protein
MVEELINTYWYTSRDNLLDFTSICAKVNGIEYQVSAATDNEMAEHIVALHNNAWDAHIWESYYDNIMEGIALDVASYYGDEPIPLPEGAAPLTEDEWFHYDEPYETTREADLPRSADRQDK